MTAQIQAQFKTRNRLLTSMVMAGALCVTACSSTPDKDSRLEEAHASFDTLKANSKAGTLATVELKEAQDALIRADKAFEEDDDSPEAKHKIYLATQRVAIAEQAYNRKLAEQTLAESSDQRNQLQLAARTAEADRAKAALAELQAKSTDRGIVMTLGDVLFDVDGSSLKPSGMRVIEKLANYLEQNPGRKVAIEGFTDSTGSSEYNQTLSERRAAAVENALSRYGIGADRVEIHGYGEEYPVAENTSSSGRQLNRRVEIVLSDEAGEVAPR